MKIKLSLFTFSLAILTAFQAAAFSLDDIQFWTGNGTNRAAMVIQWTVPEVLNNTSVAPPVTQKTLVWGFRWNGTASGEDMFNAILAADKQLFAAVNDSPFGRGVLALGYDLNDNRLIGITNAFAVFAASSLSNAPSDFTNGLVMLDYSDADVFQSLDVADLYWGGSSGPGWELWQEGGGNGGFTNAPLRSSNAYWTPDDPSAPYFGNDGQWQLAGSGMSDLQLKNGSWLGWTISAGGLNFSDPNDPGTIAYDFHKRAPFALEAAGTNYSPYAAELATSQGPFGASPYDDPLSILGEPTSLAVNFDPTIGNSPFHVKLVEAAYNRDVDGKKVILTLNRAATNSGYNYASVTVKFDHVIRDDPANPYGIDFEVFGNTFYVGSGFIGDTTDMRSYNLVGGAFAEPMLVSVSPDGTNWYTYTNGPYCDSTFPTHGFAWDPGQFDATTNGWTKRRMDFTKPVNPALDGVLGASGTTMSAFNALKFYNGSGGGTGFDLAQSGFSSIQYIRINAAPGFYAGEVDAFSVVRPAVLGESLTIAPANLTNGNSTLFFQDPGNTHSNAVTVNFHSLNGIALVSPAPLADTNAIATIPNHAVESITAAIQPVLSTDTIQFNADLVLNLGAHYKGSGNDLDLVSWNGTNWASQAFTFNANSNAVTVSGVTNSMTLAVVQILPPTLTINVGTNGIACHFVPAVGWSNILERSTDFAAWTLIDQVIATNAQPTLLVDPAPLVNKAFYRLRLAKP